MKINTAEYEFSHGSKPRGRGRWVFQVQRENGVTEPYVIHPSMTFTKAQRELTRRLRATRCNNDEKGGAVTGIDVLP